jgi:hypothetical protein
MSILNGPKHWLNGPEAQKKSQKCDIQWRYYNIVAITT